MPQPRFWKRIVELRPDLVGTVVYFSASKLTELRCVICEDGTISPIGSSLRFDSPSKLKEAWEKGDVTTEDGRKLPQRRNSSTAPYFGWKECFFKPGRKASVCTVLEELKSEETAISSDEQGQTAASDQRLLINAQTDATTMSAIIAASQRRLLSSTTTTPKTKTKKQTGSVIYNLRPNLKQTAAARQMVLQKIRRPRRLTTPAANSISTVKNPGLNLSRLAIAKAVAHLRPNSRNTTGTQPRSTETPSWRIVATTTVASRPAVTTNLVTTTVQVPYVAMTSAQPSLQSNSQFGRPVVDQPSQPIVVPVSSQDDSGLQILAETAPLLLIPIPQPAPPTKKRCPGFDRRPYQEIISSKQWDGERMQLSPVVIIGDQAWSKTCESEISYFRELCWDCKQAKRRVHTSKLQLSKTNDLTRILKTPNRLLSSQDMVKKVQHQLKAKDEALRKQIRENRLLKIELNRYRPREKTNRDPVQLVVKKMNSEERKLRSPVCKWETDNVVCDFEAPSISLLYDHISQSHIRPQVELNEERFPDDHVYECHWLRCNRAEFGRLRLFRRHVLTHSGSADTSKNLELIRETLINFARPPTGRRYERNRLMRGLIEEVAQAGSHLETSLDEGAVATSNLLMSG